MVPSFLAMPKVLSYHISSPDRPQDFFKSASSRL